MRAAIIVSICIVGALSQHEADEKPNFIMLMADDQGWGDVGYNTEHKYQHKSYNYTWTYNAPRTPNLDAMAKSDNSILFWRFYAGSGVCSPTRSAALTGRTPTRECIDGAEGCGTQPAWTCIDKMPLSPLTYTVAEAAKKANYATVHIGKVVNMPNAIIVVLFCLRQKLEGSFSLNLLLF
jgi:arylsulfatase A-like enzyme